MAFRIIKTEMSKLKSITVTDLLDCGKKHHAFLTGSTNGKKVADIKFKGVALIYYL